jgi:hypothetical protein
VAPAADQVGVICSQRLGEHRHSAIPETMRICYQ